MNPFKALGVALAALLLVGCINQDVVIHGDSGAVNVGTVTAEHADVRMSGAVGPNKYDLGTYPIAAVYPVVASQWGDEGDTSLLQKDMTIKMETFVTYLGTKNKATVLVDMTEVMCPKGFMLGTCMSKIETTANGLITLYREKFSYLK